MHPEAAGGAAPTSPKRRAAALRANAFTENPLILEADLALLRSADQPGGRYRSAFDALDRESLAFASDFHDDPSELSDWGHRYFCPDDGGKLLWDPAEAKHHRCSVCGAVKTGLPWDRVWTTFYRNEAFQSVRKAALAAAVRGVDGTAGEARLGVVRKLLGFYADRYAEFAVHAKDRVVADPTYDIGGAGKIMPQGLNEAMIIVRSIQALELVRTSLDAPFLEHVAASFFRPAASLLRPQADKIHNIPCWIQAALGSIGVFERDAAAVDAAFDAPFGLVAQLAKGVTRDGFWYEGSLHYHFFLLEGVLSFLLLAARRGFRRPRAERAVALMLERAWLLAFSSGRLPNPNDGWPDIGLGTYSYVFDLGAALLGPDSVAAALAREVARLRGERTELPLSPPWYHANATSMERLSFNPLPDSASAPAPSRVSAIWRSSCFAVLRSPELEVFLKYGHNGPSHAHPDKMSIEVMAGKDVLSRDLSNAGYGARLCDEWHRTSAAHNTVIVDGRDQTDFRRGRVLWFDEGSVSARASEVWPGVSLSRTLTLEPRAYRDTIELSASEFHVYDWLFHIDGVSLHSGPSSPATLGWTEGGSRHLAGLRSIPVAQTAGADASSLFFDFTFGCTRERVATCHVAGSGLEVFLSESLDNPVNRSRACLILRARGRKARFDVRWTFDAPTPAYLDSACALQRPSS